MFRHVLYTVLVVTVTGLSIWISTHFLSAWFEQPQYRATCTPSLSETTLYKGSGTAFNECLKQEAELFAKYDYAESKDLAKAFLTILVAVFVASVTFSEKIVGIGESGWWQKFLMILCWLLLLTSIVCCGTGIAFMTMAVGWAAHSPEKNYYVFENYGGWLLVISGISFGCALAAMLVTGIISLSRPKADESPRLS